MVAADARCSFSGQGAKRCYGRTMAAVAVPSRSGQQPDDHPGRPGGKHHPPPRAGQLWHAALVLLPALAVGIAGFHRRWMGDDGLIYTRTVREILAGSGPVFSPGERAEASTSTLWQWILALAAWVTQADAARLAVYGGLACTVLGFLLATDGTRLLNRGVEHHVQGAPPRLLLPGAIVVLLALPPVWDYATSGLETGLVTLWLGVGWWLLVRLSRPAGARPFGLLVAAFVLGLGPLVRPDLAVVTLLFLLAAARVVRPGWRRALGYLAVAAALPVAYEVFRMGYYGVLQPLPALTKEAGASDWARGLRYLVTFVGPFWLYLSLPLAAVLLGVVAARLRKADDAERPSSGTRALVAAPVVSGLVLALYVVRVGGDWMQARMLLPALFLLLLPVLVVPASRLTGAVLALLLGWSAVSLSPLQSPWHGGEGAPLQALIHSTAADNRRFTVETTGTPNPVTSHAFDAAFPDLLVGVEQAETTRRPTLLVFADGSGASRLVDVPLAPAAGGRLAVVGRWLGITGAVVPLDQRAVDQLSLAYPLGAHLAHQRGPAPGHEKLLGQAWIMADYAAPGTRAPGAPGQAATSVAIAAAAHALHCGALAELQDSVRAPLTWSRFWSNLTGAVGRTSLRVPRDPVAAERRFCGSAR